MENIKELYEVRFSPEEKAMKNRLWGVLCTQFFQKFVPIEARVLDLASGYGEFINHIEAKEKIAVDINPDTPRHLKDGIKFINNSADNIKDIESESIDVLFAGNFLEHLPNKEAVDSVFKEVFRVLKPGGSFLLLQPNIKYVGQAYWDFYDHHTPLSHLSLQEGLRKNGFEIERMIPKFLPYTVKSRIPKSTWLVSMYLHVPLAWKIMGRLMFVVAKKPAN